MVCQPGNDRRAGCLRQKDQYFRNFRGVEHVALSSSVMTKISPGHCSTVFGFVYFYVRKARLQQNIIIRDAAD
ncbi:hypothetical protein AGR1B_pa0138 [Agrobacterium fabacearum S56]|nr:hypothetical protein AGR1B_pa0138 [Agrobacterium fabacearum S56]